MYSLKRHYSTGLLSEKLKMEKLVIGLKPSIILVGVFFFIFASSDVEGDRTLEVVYEWNKLDYTWANPGVRARYLSDKRYIPENNVIAGVKVYKNQVYVTVPRWLPGIPSTLNKVVIKKNRPLLEPFPAWNWQRQDRCDALQFTQSMEIDPIHGHMWIIDAGRRDIWLEGEEVNKCPPKLMIYDLESEIFLHRHVFPDDVVSHDESFINDIVVDFDSGYAYITDVGKGPKTGNPGGIIVFRKETDTSHRIEHPSMLPTGEHSKINIDGKEYDFPISVDGIALSPDGQYLFYTPLGGLNLYQLPTTAAKDRKMTSASLPVRNLGPKPSQTDGMVMGHERLYFGSLGLNAIHAWEFKKDMNSQDKNLDGVDMKSVHVIVEDNDSLVWPDGFDLDADGYLWVTSNKLPMFRLKELDIGGTDDTPHFKICKVYVGDLAYKTKSPGWFGVLWFYGTLSILAIIIFFFLGFSEDTRKKKK